MKTEIGLLFDKYGSDKDTNHSYGPFYQNLFPDRLKVERVMEIGIAHGGGLMAFHEFYANATVVGFDKEPCHRLEVGSTDAGIFPLTPRPDRLEIYQGDMRVREDLLRSVNHRQFDLVVEDATHKIGDSLPCLLWLWPWVKPGGIYVIEEMDGVQSYRDDLSLFANAEMWEASEPHSGELLFLVRKSL